MSAPARSTADAPAAVPRRHDLAATVVTSLFRLVKACQLYDTNAETVRRSAAQLADALEQWRRKHETSSAQIHFANRVSVNRRLLRAPRETYALASQLGRILARCGVDEIEIPPCTAATLERVGRGIVDARRQNRSLLDTEVDRVGFRFIGDAFAQTAGDARPLSRVLQSYAASVLVLRRYFDRCQREGQLASAAAPKRIAARLMLLSREHLPILVAAASASPKGDTARRSVGTAVIAFAMASRLTDDESSLRSVLLAALLAEAPGMERQPGEDGLVAARRVLRELTRLGKLYDVATRRALLAFEATRPDGEKAPLLAEVLVLARGFQRHRETAKEADGAPPAQGGTGLARALDALEHEQTTETGRWLCKLLVASLGLLPTGAFVELDSGEIALVTECPSTPLDFARPTVRVLTDSSKRPLERPMEVDLARPSMGSSAGGTPRFVKRALKSPTSASNAADAHRG